MDNKPVYMISSLHSPNDTFQVKRKLKDGNTTMVPCPKVLISYNNNMNNVDVFDQLKAAYGINRKVKKWWHRLFFHFLDMVIVNAFILFKELIKEKMSMKDFRRRIVDGLLAPNQLQPQKKIIVPVVFPNINHIFLLKFDSKVLYISPPVGR